ncbi:hypothetical protein Y032_0002g1063 [Ancylostoma ceylanicum]|uniref:Uncharacterized protein n=1 Tax=Ancylostoma ceylanicum TaxID=53326 RepID=A0A016VZ89_9BILA|nr:hypothetical protein Y032_0002g1063 [Ancylostoma ceylanicum]
MPANIKTMKDYAFFFRLTMLLELLTGHFLQRVPQDDLRTWTERILSIATVIFDGASGQTIENPGEGRIRFDLSGNFYLFECNKCPHVTSHSLRVHLKYRCGFLMHYPAVQLIDFSTPETTAIFAMEQVWIGEPRPDPTPRTRDNQSDQADDSIFRADGNTTTPLPFRYCPFGL